MRVVHVDGGNQDALVGCIIVPANVLESRAATAGQARLAHTAIQVLLQVIVDI